MAGYTALLQTDERLALDRRARYWDALERHHEAFEGTIVQRLGDGSMSMFPSSLAAVQAAVAGLAAAAAVDAGPMQQYASRQRPRSIPAKRASSTSTATIRSGASSSTARAPRWPRRLSFARPRPAESSPLPRRSRWLGQALRRRRSRGNPEGTPARAHAASGAGARVDGARWSGSGMRSPS
jgi:hypothetical protein